MVKAYCAVVFIAIYLSMGIPLEAKDLLLSYNKCSTHFTLFSLQYLTQRPIRSIVGEGFSHFHTNLPVIDSKKPLFHTHVLDASNANKIQRLIVLVRSPVELFLRMYGFEQSKLLLEIIVYKLPYNSSLEILNAAYDYSKGMPVDNALRAMRNFFKMVSLYREFPRKKTLIFYEDVIAHPEEVMKHLLKFLKEDDSLLDTYTKQLENIRKNCLIAYTNQFQVSSKISVRSDSCNVFYYQEKHTSEEVEELKRLIQLALGPKNLPYIQRFF